MDDVTQLKEALKAGVHPPEQTTFSESALAAKFFSSQSLISNLASQPRPRTFTLYVDESGCTGTRLTDKGSIGTPWFATYGIIAEDARLATQESKLRELAMLWGVQEIKGAWLYSNSRLNRKLGDLGVPLRQGFVEARAICSNKVGQYKEMVLVHHKLNEDVDLESSRLNEELSDNRSSHPIALHAQNGRGATISYHFGGRKPEWGGFMPQFLSYPVCREMAAILAESRPLPYLDEAATQSIGEQRRDLGPALAVHPWSVHTSLKGESLLTFAGGAVNQTLKYGLNLLKGWSCRSDNFRLRLDDSVTHSELRDALKQLAQAEFWENPETRDLLMASMPEYRLSKFQQVLPRRFALEMVQAYLLDIETTRQFLALV